MNGGSSADADILSSQKNLLQHISLKVIATIIYQNPYLDS